MYASCRTPRLLVDSARSQIGREDHLAFQDQSALQPCPLLVWAVTAELQPRPRSGGMTLDLCVREPGELGERAGIMTEGLA